VFGSNGDPADGKQPNQAGRSDQNDEKPVLKELIDAPTLIRIPNRATVSITCLPSFARKLWTCTSTVLLFYFFLPPIEAFLQLCPLIGLCRDDP